ncbi:MAG: hypothetical protein DIU72_010425 [Pseudomonadota bacterium]|nr:MAG: hypothetical protein DIU72_10010 [Pseudomonadota bacterium]
MDRSGARIACIVLGVWLFVSAFLLPYSGAQFTNTWAVGLAVVVFALAGIASVPARFLITLAAVWLFLSVWILPGASTGAKWNSALVAVLLFILSLAPGQSERPILPPARRVRA